MPSGRTCRWARTLVPDQAIGTVLAIPLFTTIETLIGRQIGPATVQRIIGRLWFSNSSTGAEQVAMGIVALSEQAGAGRPDLETNLDADWLWWDTVRIPASSNEQSAGVFAQTFQQMISFDVKSQRKLRSSNRSLQLIFGSAAGASHFVEGGIQVLLLE